MTGFYLRLFALGMLVIPFVVSEHLTEYANFPKLLLLHGLIYWVLLISLFDKPFRQNLIRNFRRLVNPGILALLIWAGITISYSIDRFEAVHSFNQAWMCFLLILWAQSVPRLDQLQSLLQRVFTLSGMGIAVLIQIQFYTGWDGIGQSVGPAATFFNKNVAAHFLIVSLCFSIAEYWTRETSKARLLYLLSVLLQLQAFFLINSQASTLSLILSVGLVLGLLVFAHRNEFISWVSTYRLRGIALIGVTSFALITASFSIGIRDEESFWGRWFDFSSYFENEELDSARFEESSAIQVRLSLYRNTLHMIAENDWTGVGLGSWNDHYPAIPSETGDYRAILLNRMPHTAHNDYLQLFAETGWVGALLFIVIALLIIRNLTVLFRENPFLVLQRTPILIALLTILMNAALSSYASLAWDSSIFALCLGLILNRSKERSDVDAANRLSLLPKTLVITVCGVVSLLITTLAYGQRFHADIHWLEVMKAFKRQDYPAAVEAGETARAILPVHDRILPYLARAYFNSGQFEAAEDCFKQYLIAHPYHLHVRYQLIETYRKQGEYEAAMALSRDTLALLPHDYELRYQHGLMLVDTGQIDAALSQFESMLKDAETEHTLPILYWITQLSYALNDLDKCAETILKIDAIQKNYDPLVQWMRMQVARPGGRAKMVSLRDKIAQKVP